MTMAGLVDPNPIVIGGPVVRPGVWGGTKITKERMCDLRSWSWQWRSFLVANLRRKARNSMIYGRAYAIDMEMAIKYGSAGQKASK